MIGYQLTGVIEMTETISKPAVEGTFEETVFTRAAQLLADPITDSTRKRQGLLLLLSVLSLAVFFGVVVPEKVSVPGVDVRMATPLTPTGAPSSTAASVATTALRFSRVLCPVLIYLLLSFWLSLYRDYEAQKYLRGLAQLKINEAATRDYAASEKRQRKRLAIIERFRSATTKRSEESAVIQRKIQEISDEFKKPQDRFRRRMRQRSRSSRTGERKGSQGTRSWRRGCQGSARR
jgi:hypothetical protein